MPRIGRLVIKNEQAVYHVMSRTALDGYPFGDLEKEFLVDVIRKEKKGPIKYAEQHYPIRSNESIRCGMESGHNNMLLLILIQLKNYLKNMVILPFLSLKKRYRDSGSGKKKATLHSWSSVASYASLSQRGILAQVCEGSSEVKEFTGVSSPYEPSEKPELVVDTDMVGQPLADCVAQGMSLLRGRGVVG